MRNLLCMAFMLGLCLSSCTSDVEQASPKIATQDTGTRQMMDSLAAIYARTNFKNHPYASHEMLAILQKEIETAQSQNRIQLNDYFQYAWKLLDAGKTQESIDIYNRILSQVSAAQEVNDQTQGMYQAMGIAYLRLAEQENCILNHSDESCIFPIQGKGIHTRKEGAQKAIEIYTKILRQFPEDLQSRWLINIAYMTIGEYPDKVPAKWLIPATQFASDYDLPMFKNIASGLQLDVNGLAGGTIADDFDNDGFIDIVASSWGMKDQIRYFRNQGDGTFKDETQSTGLTGLTGGLNVLQADYNNDGFLDFFILRGAWNAFRNLGVQPNSLIRNNGDGTFSDVTFEAGLYTVNPTQSAVWADFNLDGWIDLYVANETPNQKEPHPCEFYLNNGDGTFRSLAQQTNIAAVGYFKGVGAADVNNDGRPDLYLSNLAGKNLLFLNQVSDGPEGLQFENVSQRAGVEEPMTSFPLWFFDYDNDGDEDLLVLPFDIYGSTEQAYELAADWLDLEMQGDLPRLYQNQGDGTFTNQTSQTRLNHALHTMGCNYGDLDNDGYLDFYLGTGAPDYRSIVPNRMLRNKEGQFFQDVTTAGRFGHLQKGHGIGFADFDNDGDQDIYTVMGGSVAGDVFQNAFFQNPGNDNNWLSLQLEGQKSNKMGVGARIRITIQEGDQQRVIHSTVSSGSSFGANSLRQEIGLGKAKAILKLEINWPDGKWQYLNYSVPEINQAYRVVEGESTLIPLALPTFEFSLGEGGHHHHHH